MGNHHGSGVKRSQSQSQKRQTRAEGRKDVAIDVEFEVSEAGLGFCHHGTLRCNCDAVEGTFVVHTEGVDSCSEGGMLVTHQGVVELYDEVAEEAVEEEAFTGDAAAVVVRSEAVGSHDEAVRERTVTVDSEAVVSDDEAVTSEAVTSHSEAVVSHDEAVTSEAVTGLIEAVGGEDSDSSEEEYVHRCVFMVRVLPDDQSSGSEVQFRQQPNVAPAGNTPPAPVDSHQDVRPRVTRPSGVDAEGTAADAVPSTSRSRTSEVGPGYGATIWPSFCGKCKF